jgi:glycosyltransferase involved in cell wall biosynthesis
MGKKMKIGQIVSFGVGGADKCALNLIKGLLLLNEDLEITVFYNKYSHPRADETATNPSRFEEYKTLPIKLVEFNDVAELNNYDIDILNTHRSGNDSWFLPNFESTTFNFKIVETNFHGYNMTKSDIRIYPSEGLLSNLQPSSIPFRVIPNPINRKVTDEDLRTTLGISDKFVYGRIARPDTNIYSNINLSAYKRVEGDDTCFLYVAPNPMAISDAHNLGLKNIIFIDPTSDELMVSKLYNTFDVLCHSNSLGETFGNTIAEAMINSKPIITHIGRSSWCQAHEELVGEKTELFIRDNIVDNYANLMLKLKNDKNYYNEISKYLKDRADSLYDYVSVSKRYYDLYKEMI